MATSLGLVGFVATAVVSAAAGSFCDDQGWSVVWRDEFSGTKLNDSSWTLDFKGNDSRVRDSQGTAANVYVEDGALVLRSQREQINGYRFTSGAVQTQGLVSWRGLTRACVRAKLPGAPGHGDGIWPAHWMMPDNNACWPSNGEIDIMEMVNGDGVLHGTYHWQPNGWCADKPERHPSISNQTLIGPDWASGWHEYAVEYSPDHIHFVIDGRVYSNITAGSVAHNGDRAEFFDVPYYMILNTALGGPWPEPVDTETALPAYHRIDYVRVAQPRGGAFSSAICTRDAAACAQPACAGTSVCALARGELWPATPTAHER